MAAIEDITRASACRTIDLWLRGKNISTLPDVSRNRCSYSGSTKTCWSSFPLIWFRIGSGTRVHGEAASLVISFRISTEAICLIYRIGFRVPVVTSMLKRTSRTHILVRRGYADLKKSRYALWFFVVLFECCRSLVRSAKEKKKSGDENRLENRWRKLASITRKVRDKMDRPLGEPQCLVVVSAEAERASALRASAAARSTPRPMPYLKSGKATHSHLEVMYKAKWLRR